MNQSVGTDIVKNKRVIELFNKYKDNFLEKILTPEEVTRFKKNNNIQSLVGTFAAKEATIKALHDLGFTEITMQDIVIISRANSSPLAFVKSNVKIHISISHETEYTIAIALCTTT